MRTITLPALNKTISLGQYVKAVKMAKAMDDPVTIKPCTCGYEQALKE